MTEPPLKAWLEREDALLRVRLARPKANIVDAAMIAALHGALREHAANAKLRGVLLDAAGPHFSFGASVDEHRAESCEATATVLPAPEAARAPFETIAKAMRKLAGD